MILVNNVPKTNAEIAEMFKLPLKKILDESEFIINENLKGYDLGSKKKRDMGPLRFPSVFNVEDKNGVNVEIRYTTGKANVKDKDGKTTVVFSPKKVVFEGDFTIPPKADLALYFYMHTKCKNSPFRTEESGIWTYEYKDKEHIAGGKVNRGDTMLEALNHAKSYKGDDLTIMAKGMGVLGTDTMTELQIQAELTDLAMANPAEYLRKTASEVTMINGKIIDAIEKGIFVLAERYGVHMWKWGFGVNKGETVCDITNNSVPANDFLVNYLKQNLNKYYDEIMTAKSDIDADAKAHQFLKDRKQVASIDLNKKNSEAALNLAEFKESDFDNDPSKDDNYEPEFNLKLTEKEPDFPVDFTTARTYLTFYKEAEGMSSNKHASQLWSAIEKEGLQPSTIREWCKSNIGY